MRDLRVPGKPWMGCRTKRRGGGADGRPSGPSAARPAEERSDGGRRSAGGFPFGGGCPGEGGCKSPGGLKRGSGRGPSGLRSGRLAGRPDEASGFRGCERDPSGFPLIKRRRRCGRGAARAVQTRTGCWPSGRWSGNDGGGGCRAGWMAGEAEALRGGGGTPEGVPDEAERGSQAGGSSEPRVRGLREVDVEGAGCRRASARRRRARSGRGRQGTYGIRWRAAEAAAGSRLTRRAGQRQEGNGHREVTRLSEREKL
jgi:hypothetical protein